jgi:hypothetical protein
MTPPTRKLLELVIRNLKGILRALEEFLEETK